MNAMNHRHRTHTEICLEHKIFISAHHSSKLMKDRTTTQESKKKGGKDKLSVNQSVTPHNPGIPLGILTRIYNTLMSTCCNKLLTSVQVVKSNASRPIRVLITCNYVDLRKPGVDGNDNLWH